MVFFLFWLMKRERERYMFGCREKKISMMSSPDRVWKRERERVEVRLVHNLRVSTVCTWWLCCVPYTHTSQTSKIKEKKEVERSKANFFDQHLIQLLLHQFLNFLTSTSIKDPLNQIQSSISVHPKHVFISSTFRSISI